MTKLSNRKLFVSSCIVFYISFLTTAHVLAFTTLQTNNVQSLPFIPKQKTCLQQQQLGTFEPLNIPTQQSSSSSSSLQEEERSIAFYNYSSTTPIPYEPMWNMQKKLLQCHLNRLSSSSSSSCNQFLSVEDTSILTTLNGYNIHSSESHTHSFQDKDAIIMLQHTPVYTLGTASDPNYITSQDNVDIIRIERGGEVTCHAPGQLTVYPILDLRGYRQDIHWYMRALEECILIALEKAGVQGATREEDLTGVWVQNKKIAALGVKVRRWVTMHGLAVNVEHSCVSYFDGIVPCGLVGRQVCCINDFLDEPMSVAEFSVCMKEAMEEVFEVALVEV
mmetsp:Transcript_20715/g.30056  ORF Transcript_20715/g.30056 Transcript_20715/m.30056 type:complete len:334 (-) Transcript_20715:291-1292(-)